MMNGSTTKINSVSARKGQKGDRNVQLRRRHVMKMEENTVRVSDLNIHKNLI